MTGFIENIALRLSDIPTISDGYLAISKFALTFNGYVWDTNIGENANEIAERYLNDNTVLCSCTLSELRGYLFYEQRRHHHYGEEPGVNDLLYIHALLVEIYDRVEKAVY
jgi:hypothetical protein